MMGFFAVFMSLVCAINLNIIITKLLQIICSKKEQYYAKEKAILSVFTIIIMLFSTAIHVTTLYNVVSQDKDFIDEEYETEIINTTSLSHFRINREYLPVKAILQQSTYMSERRNKTYVLSGSGTIISEEKDRLHLQIKVENMAEGTILEFPYLYYPGYHVTLNVGDEQIQLQAKESENGYISVEIPQYLESANIEIKYQNTTITIISYIVSSLGVVMLIIYIILFKRKNKRSLKQSEN